MEPLEVICAILKLHPQIAAVSTRVVRSAPPFEARAAGSPTAALVRRAEDLKGTAGVPFMDGLNLALIESGTSDANIIRSMLFRNPKEVVTWTPAATIASDGFQDRSESTGDLHVVSSEVRIDDGSSLHIAMLDFHVPASPSARAQVTQICRAIGGGGGWVLESGRSYHYYGKSLLAPREWTELLGRALMFAPITDRGWIAHQLVDGACCLRTGVHPSKIGSPVVVEELA